MSYFHDQIVSIIANQKSPINISELADHIVEMLVAEGILQANDDEEEEEEAEAEGDL